MHWTSKGINKIMILIIIALEQEIDLNEFQFLKKEIINLYPVYYLKENLILSFCGAGKVNAAGCTTALINHFQTNLKQVFNLGTAGSFKSITSQSCFLAYEFQYLDVDVTSFGYAINQVPKQPKPFIFKITSFFEVIKNLLKELNINYQIGLSGSADSFININNYQKFRELEIVDAIDMEAASIAHITKIYGINFLSVKFISDSIFSQTKSSDAFKQNLATISQQISSILKKLQKQNFII